MQLSSKWGFGVDNNKIKDLIAFKSIYILFKAFGAWIEKEDPLNFFTDGLKFKKWFKFFYISNLSIGQVVQLIGMLF